MKLVLRILMPFVFAVSLREASSKVGASTARVHGSDSRRRYQPIQAITKTLHGRAVFNPLMFNFWRSRLWCSLHGVSTCGVSFFLLVHFRHPATGRSFFFGVGLPSPTLTNLNKPQDSPRFPYRRGSVTPQGNRIKTCDVG